MGRTCRPRGLVNESLRSQERGLHLRHLFPQSGHEQKGRRPALVVSNTVFNEQTGLAIVCPLATTHRGYPFHVVVIGNPDVKGFVMVEQVKSIDYRARPARSLGKASEDLLDEVLSILDACIYWRPNPSLQPTRNPRG